MKRYEMETIPMEESVPVRHVYGAQPSQYGDLYRPLGSQLRGVVVLVHGGFWRAHRGLEMTAPAAAALAARGWHVWNIEYRRGGPWRDTVEDCVQAYQHYHTISEHGQIAKGVTLLVGHSAGGHLAAWVARAQRGADKFDGLVTLNGVVDLGLAHELGTGDAAVAEFLGPEATAADLHFADTAMHFPPVPVRCVHSRDDERVPFEISASYVNKACAAACDAALVEVPGQHTAVIEPGSAAWPTVLQTIESNWPKDAAAKENT